MWFLNEPFLIYALIGAIAAGVICAFIGVFISLKNIIFVGLALSEVAALGVAFGFFAGLNPVLGAFVVTILAGIFFWNPEYAKVFSAETIIGFTFCFAGALSLIIVSKAPLIRSSGVDLLAGNILYISRSEIVLIIAVGLLIALIYGLYMRKFLYVCFDPESATAAGVSAKKYDFLIYFTLSLVIAVSMRSTGVLFVFGSLIIPPLIGLMLGNRIWKVFVIAVLVSILSAPVGIIISYYGDYPTSPVITLVKAVFAIVVFPFYIYIRKV